METDNKKIRIKGGRLAEARVLKGLRQKDLCLMISEYFNGADTICLSLISQWECGRRSIPTKYNNAICRMLDVTEEYLCGMTDDPTSHICSPKPVVKDVREISEGELCMFDGEPVYVVFETYEWSDGWAIFNADAKQFCFRDGPRYIHRPKECRFYVSIPEFCRVGRKDRRGLTLSQMMNASKIYVVMLSPDPLIRIKYEGWYEHNESRTNIIQTGTGLALPYSGLNISYNAFSSEAVYVEG